MTTELLATGLIYTTLGVAVALTWVYAFGRQFLGGLWGALIVAVLGSFLGAVFEHLFSDMIGLLTDVGGVNIFPALAAAIVVIAVFAAVCEHGTDADE